MFADSVGLGAAGTGFMPHTIIGDIADVSEPYLEKIIDEKLSGLTNLMNKT